MINAKQLQHAVGALPDGIIGHNTYAAMFRKLGASPERAAELALSANVHFAAYGIMQSKLRLAHLMAQLVHESCSFRYMEEIASGSAYEGRVDLGNSQVGDGRRYKGRGPIQLTGRANYRKFGRRMGIDFENHPEIVALPCIGLHIALEYWADRKLNSWADADDIDAITRKINGGTNGLADRKHHLKVIKGWLS